MKYQVQAITARTDFNVGEFDTLTEADEYVQEVFVEDFETDRIFHRIVLVGDEAPTFINKPSVQEIRINTIPDESTEAE